MHVKTLLNHVTKFKGFVFQQPKLCRNSDKLLIPIEPRKNSKPICSLCGHPRTVCDHLSQCEFLLPPIWNIVVVLLYTMRRVNCLHCGKVVVEQVPWATGKSPITKQFAAFLAHWARKLSWKDTAKSFRVSWDTDRIFGVFQKLHGPGTHEGTSMGLALCRKIVENHSGDIKVESVVGEGSKFTVILPAEQD